MRRGKANRRISNRRSQNRRSQNGRSWNGGRGDAEGGITAQVLLVRKFLPENPGGGSAAAYRGEEGEAFIAGEDGVPIPMDAVDHDELHLRFRYGQAPGQVPD